MNPDLHWIPGPWPGKLAIAARPRGGDWLRDELNRWRTANVDLVVSLLESSEAAEFHLDDEAAVAESAGIGFISFPIPDRSAPASTQNALALLQTAESALEQGKKIVVHCRQGIGRSGLIAAALLAQSGVALANAIETVSHARGQTIPETPTQLDWLRHAPLARDSHARSSILTGLPSA